MRLFRKYWLLKLIRVEFYTTTGGKYKLSIFSPFALITSSQILNWCVLQSAKQLDKCLPYKNNDSPLFTEKHNTISVKVW